jgi:DNA (cytosine-5)-methyltransferase 1
MQTQPLTALDLFCGCGGFTLGLQRAGFHVLAAIDFNREAVETLTENLIRREHPDFAPVKHALTKDLTKYHPQELASLINTNHVDLIVGGPPCQGFSTARQVDGANHGSRLKFDSRRYLYQEFLRYVDHFQPKIFGIHLLLSGFLCFAYLLIGGRI